MLQMSTACDEDWTFRLALEDGMSLPRYAFFQGRVVPYSEARVGVLTHGLNYGTGVFSGIRGYWNADSQRRGRDCPPDAPAGDGVALSEAG